jgi:hypothetical protein
VTVAGYQNEDAGKKQGEGYMVVMMHYFIDFIGFDIFIDVMRSGLLRFSGL